MGKLSYLVICNKTASKVQIDWEKVDEEKVATVYDLKRCKASISDYQPETVSELAEELDETKLFGYLTNDYIEALQEVCMSMYCDATIPDATMPRIYFEEEGRYCLHYLEFHPGTTTVVKGTHEWCDREEFQGLPDYPFDEDDKDMIDAYHDSRKITKSVVYTRLIAEGTDWNRTMLEAFDIKSEAAVLTSLMKEYGIDSNDPDADDQLSRLVNAAKAAGVSLASLVDE
jgi:hypothetical protein